MSSTAHLSQTLPTLLYNNIFNINGAALSYSGVENSAHPLGNAFDWLTYTRFFATANATYIEVILPSPEEVDCVGIYYQMPEDSDGTNYSITVQSVVGGIPSNIFEFDIPETGSVDNFILFDKLNTPVSTDTYRVVFTIPISPSGLTLNIRNICLGKCIQPELGQWNGIRPSDLQFSFKAYNSIAVNGEVIGRSIIRTERSGDLNFTLCSQEWVRSVWYPFMKHALRKAFYYAWNFNKYPNEVAFSTATNLPAPSNAHPPGKMEVSLSMKIVSD